MSEAQSGEPRVTELGSGVRVVTEEVPSVRSVALGLWVRTGSRNETPAQAGVSHFLEHLLFKGTPRYSAIEISERFDGLGASVNAATGKETTHLHARFLDEHTDAVFDLLAEMLLDPAYPEIDSERQVVLEEIAMYEDEPQDRVHDVLAEAVFGSHPLGRRVLGEAEVIASIPIPDIDAYHRARYAGPEIVVGAAGHLDHERIVGLTERLVSPEGAGGDQPDMPLRDSAQLCFHQKETEQYHICFGAPGLRRDDERRYALAVLDSIFGGSTSSRLFREVREKRGLAYSVGSYNEQFTDQGLVATYVGTREDNVEEACSIIGAELARLRSEPVSGEELNRAKESVKGRLVLSSESTAARMTRISRATLFGLPIESLDQMLARVDAVEVEELTALAAELYGDALQRHPGLGLRRRRRGEVPGGTGAGLRDLGSCVIRVGVSGAAGRMGGMVCEAVEAAEGLELAGRADPALGVGLGEILGEVEVVVDFTVPNVALENLRECLAAGVHVVVGTTGFDLDAAREAAEASAANLFVAPNFAIGAVLMMEVAQKIAPPLPECELIELHHDRKLDAPSGTAKRTAELIEAAGGNVHQPIHSVRLPGLVAHQEVIFGGVGQTLTVRHDSIDRRSFMPGVVLAVRKVGGLPDRFTVGLEKLL